MATYSYIDKNGKTQTVEASSPQDALSKAPNIDSHSGVQAMGASQSGQATPAQTNDTSSLDFLGFTPEQISSMSPGDQQQWGLVGTYLQQQANLGNVASENNALSLQKAYQAATQDPNIVAKYGDLDKSSAQLFNNNLQALQTTTDVDQQNQQLDFNQQQKDLADQEAQAGRAYSGFRNQAENRLNTQQQGIVTSSLSNLKQQLQGQLSPLEQLYGTKGLNNLIGNQSVSYLNPINGQRQNVGYDQIGGLTGSLGAQKEGDVSSRQAQIYTGLASP